MGEANDYPRFDVRTLLAESRQQVDAFERRMIQREGTMDKTARPQMSSSRPPADCHPEDECKQSRQATVVELADDIGKKAICLVQRLEGIDGFLLSGPSEPCGNNESCGGLISSLIETNTALERAMGLLNGIEDKLGVVPQKSQH